MMASLEMEVDITLLGRIFLFLYSQLLAFKIMFIKGKLMDRQ